MHPLFVKIWGEQMVCGFHFYLKKGQEVYRQVIKLLLIFVDIFAPKYRISMHFDWLLYPFGFGGVVMIREESNSSFGI